MILISKAELLQQLEISTRAHLHTIQSSFENMEEATLNTLAPDNGWSIVQCLEHLNSYGRYYIPLIQKAIHKEHGPNTELQVKSSWLGRYFTNMMIPSAQMHKYKALKDHIPALQLQAKLVITESIQQQHTLIEILNTAQHTDINAIKIPISIARFLRLRLTDVLQFIVAHNERHLQQALRLAQFLESSK